MNSINKNQEEIIDLFSTLGGDKEMMIDYLIEIGSKLKDLPTEEQNDLNLIKGCQSKVWVTATMQDDKIVFQADSNTTITKGLIALLLQALNYNTPKNVMEAEIYFPKEIKMDRFIGSQRSNGFGAMIKQLKFFALALSTKETQ